MLVVIGIPQETGGNFQMEWKVKNFNQNLERKVMELKETSKVIIETQWNSINTNIQRNTQISHNKLGRPRNLKNYQ